MRLVIEVGELSELPGILEFESLLIRLSQNSFEDLSYKYLFLELDDYVLQQELVA